ncbi:MAG: hypothetical protein EBR94_07075 [Bacteroidetes bacterium]|jgi:hypothetical protein|nr:hypothetical protein [Bacteroidota bacterium]
MIVMRIEIKQVFMRIGKKLNGFLGVAMGVFSILVGCGQDSHVDAAAEPDSFVRFAQNEIAWLQKSQPGMTKTVTEGENVETESMDSLNWDNELEAIRTWSLHALSKKSKIQPAYDTTIDESGALKIVRMNARDTSAELQELMVTYRKGKIELMQWSVIQRSWYMDRDLRISFQPRKGYGIQVKENAIWSSEKSYEIYIEINNSDFLINGK